MVVSNFFILDKDGKERFFEKSFLLANVNPDIILGMFKLTMSEADIDFQARDLQWSFYTTESILPTIKQVQLIKKKMFAAAALDQKHKAFVVHIATLNVDLGDEVHSLKKAQIAHLKVDKVFTKIFCKYADFADVFSSKLAAELLEQTKINNYVIKLMDD